jgi:transcriptional regulator with XRE-family HTH domain
MEIKKAVGKAIKDVRNSKALNQEFFSVVSSTSHMSRVENGQYGATVEFIDKIATAMDVHPLTILTLSFLNANEGQNVSAIHDRVSKELLELKVFK